MKHKRPSPFLKIGYGDISLDVREVVTAENYEVDKIPKLRIQFKTTQPIDWEWRSRNPSSQEIVRQIHDAEKPTGGVGRESTVRASGQGQ